MEYTATGFVQPIKRVFSTIYQPTVKLETEFLEESRYFAKRRRFEFHIEPMFQKYLYDPVITFIHGHGRPADGLIQAREPAPLPEPIFLSHSWCSYCCCAVNGDS